jgi:hypothetical protein
MPRRLEVVQPIGGQEHGGKLRLRVEEPGNALADVARCGAIDSSKSLATGTAWSTSSPVVCDGTTIYVSLVIISVNKPVGLLARLVP